MVSEGSGETVRGTKDIVACFNERIGASGSEIHQVQIPPHIRGIQDVEETREGAELHKVASTERRLIFWTVYIIMQCAYNRMFWTIYTITWCTYN